jgi:hypothetical protein
MGVRAASTYSFNLVQPLQAGTTETIVFILAPVILAADNATVVLAFFVQLQTGGGQLNYAFSLRRGLTVTSPIIGNGPWVQTCTGVPPTFQGGWYADQPGVAAAAYCLTYHGSATGGMPFFDDGCLLAFVL